MVITGVVAIIILLVDAETVSQPLLKVITYKENPDKPDNKNHFISFLCGIFIFKNTAIIIKNNAATKYRKEPSENAEKYFSVILVKTYARAQKTMVTNAYG
jgi:hypothetical protein